MTGLLAQLGDRTLQSVAAFGAFWRFFGQISSWLVAGINRWRNWRLVAPVAYEVGNRSVPVILITGTFVGMVLIGSFDKIVPGILMADLRLDIPSIFFTVGIIAQRGDLWRKRQRQE